MTFNQWLHPNAGRDVKGIRRLTRAALFLVICCVCTPAMSGEAVAPLSVSKFQLTDDADAHITRIELKLSRSLEPSWFLLKAPYRLVIDLPETQFAIDPKSTESKGLVSIVRYGHFAKNHARIILGGTSPFEVAGFAVKPGGDGGEHTLAIELVPTSKSHFDAALAERAGLQVQVRVTEKSDRLGVNAVDKADRPFTVVLDPGHGGIDGGALGVSGTEEKTITLAFGLELRKKLEDHDNVKVIMTRSDDEFLRLSERVRIARQHEADLFISIHADTIRYHGVRGATVYTVSAQASDRVAAEIAKSENLADQIAGIPLEKQNHEVSDILLDLMRRETQTFSIRFARSLIGEMSDTIELIKNPHRHAGFQVLTAPDVPSVLVELGYLSNPKDETLLRDPHWRGRATDSIVKAVLNFSRSRENAMGG